MKTRRLNIIIISAILSVVALGACGVPGKLETPPPLWGDKDQKAEKPNTSN